MLICTVTLTPVAPHSHLPPIQMVQPEGGPAVRFNALGTTELLDAGGRSIEAVLSQPKRLALLAYLCIARPVGFRRRDELLALFWPESDDARARAALSQALHRLRGGLGPESILTRGDEVAVDGARVASDVAALDRALAEGRLDEALALYRGDLLPGLVLGDVPEFERWLDGERAALRERASRAAADGVERARARGAPADAVRWARRAVELAPYDEAAVRRCVTVLAEQGDVAGAVRCFEEFDARLRRDLELEPAAETVALLGRIKGARARAALAPTPPAAAVVTPADTSPAAPPPPPRPPPPPARSRATLRPALLIAAGVALVGLALTVMPRRPRSDGSPVSQRVLVLPFTVRGDSGLAFLREGMVDLLSTRLDGLAGVQAVDPHAVLAGGRGKAGSEPTPAQGAALARQLGAGMFLTGGVVGVGGGVEISASLFDSTGQRAALLSARAPSLAALSAAVDDLARQLAASHLQGPARRLSRLAALTTDSLAALRAYLTGEQELRRSRFAPAVEAFRAAVAVDSAFALAWFRLAVALEWTQASSPERQAAAERALATSGRLTERDRMLVRAYHAYSYGSLEEAEATYRRLVTLFPDDIEAWYGIAEVLFHAGPLRGQPMAQAEPAFRRVLALYPDHVEARLHLARLLALRGDRAALDSLVGPLLSALPPQGGQGLRLRVLRAAVTGDTAAAAALVPEVAALAEGDILETVGVVASMAGDLDGAARLARLLAGPAHPPRWRVAAHVQLAYIATAEGRWIEARRELEAAGRDDPVMALLGRAFLSALPWLPLSAAERDSVRRELAAWDPSRLTPVSLSLYPMLPDLAPGLRAFGLAALASVNGDSDGARAGFAALAALGPLAAPRPRDWELAANARALAALESGDAGRALSALEGLRPGAGSASFARTYPYTHALERWLRAEALRRAGRAREALDWYETFTQYLGLVDVPFLAPAWLRQGQVLEELGQRAEARAAYQRVLARWWRADPLLEPLIREAQEGLARVSR